MHAATHQIPIRSDSASRQPALEICDGIKSQADEGCCCNRLRSRGGQWALRRSFNSYSSQCAGHLQSEQY